MATYCINTETNVRGDHEVHVMPCFYMPEPRHCHVLGEIQTCEEAMTAARQVFPQVNGCFFCARQCHTP